jgi:glycosyltransferase involved in cell wall biosynthesis
MGSRSTALRILHVGIHPDIGQANGPDVASWPLLSAQVTAGADVCLLVLGDLDQASHDEATNVGVSVTTAPSHHLETLSNEARTAITRISPDVVHFHSVFIPAHAQIAWALRRMRIPYFLTPHAGLNLWRGKLKKAIYGSLIEKPYFRGANTIFVLTEREQRVVTDWLGQAEKLPRYEVLPNSLVPLPQHTSLWRPRAPQELVYLGRFDVAKKGLDRLVEIARLLPEVQVNAYGTASTTERRGFEDLRNRGIPANMHFCQPVYGEAKREALASATMYVQPSRDDGFPMSIVEAMQLGVPVAVTRGCDLSESIGRNDLGMMLPDEPSSAAATLRSVIEDPDRLHYWSLAGRKWTIDSLSPTRVARQTLGAYERALSR